MPDPGAPIPVRTVAGGDEVEQALYAKRQKIYPREVHGLFALLRTAAVFALLGLYYGVPWIPWDGRQAILFDLPGRKFHLFGLTLWPQDLIYLSGLLIIAALSLFFFTALAGRLWCGYACPQTVWTEVFLWIERKIEGDRPRQMKLAAAPWNARKIGLRSTKHTVWIVFSLWTGFTFVGYFTPIQDLGARIATFELGPWETFWVLFYSFATYGNAGWLREQVCIYMCPYARFQSAMFDRNTLIISYDPARGEPRGSRKRGADPKALGLGDCIDCTLCVQVCPTGIDIRNGLQYECIGCAACIDACDDVMEKMQYPKGLIRYTTENAVEGKPTRVLRPRVIIYGLLLLALLGALGTALYLRVPLAVDVIRDRNVLFRETDEGLVENVYVLKILNKTERPQVFTIDVSGIEGADLLLDHEQIEVLAGEVRDVPLRVRADPHDLPSASSDIVFSVRALGQEGLQVQETGRFLGPGGVGR
jgi:cytochrome c oxidase accessory protein FixG